MGWLAVVAACLLLPCLDGGGAARAEPSGAAARARQHHRAGKAAYAQGDYAAAVREFSRGYELDPRPAFLLNIAQSHRGLGDRAQAIRYYEAFLKAAPTSPLRAQVEEIVRELQPPAVEAPVDPSPPVAAAPRVPSARRRADPPAEAPPAKSAVARPFYRRWWFWTAVSAVAVAGAGIGIGIYAGSRSPSYVPEGGLGAVRW